MNEIVVGVEGSDASAAALQWAVEEARLRGTTLRVVHSWTRLVASGPMGMPMLIDTNLVESLRSAAEKIVDRMVSAASISGVEVHRDVLEGGAAQALVDAATGADLLVVGSRARVGFIRLLLGSVSQQCAHHASWPVVIVRAPARAGS
jgi:nucleotide-binding universal stress UspA family protein